MIKIGSHIQFKAPDYLVGAARDSKNNGANAAMIYLGAPQSSRRVEMSRYKLEAYKQDWANIIKPEDIIIHAPYITNPANPEKRGFAIDFLIKDIERMNYIGAKYLVLHPGAHTKFERQDSLDSLIYSLKEIISKTKDVIILIETMSGKGTEIGTTFAEMEWILRQMNSSRIGVCLDTCHVWDAGYDIKKHDEFMAEYKKYNLLEATKVIHVNDSKNDLNSHKDRHENLGKGFIGLEPLKMIVNSPEFADAIMILETPWTEKGPIYDQEIKMLINA